MDDEDPSLPPPSDLSDAFAPPLPPPSDLSDAVAPPVAAAEERRSAAPQCEEVDDGRPTQSTHDSAADGQTEEEEKPQLDESDEGFSLSLEDESFEREDKAASLHDEEEEEEVKVLAIETEAAVHEVMQEEDVVLGVALPSPEEKLNEQMPQLAEGISELQSLKEEEEDKDREEKALVCETAVSEVFQINIEEKPNQAEELNTERVPLAEEDGQGNALQAGLAEEVEKASPLEEEFEGRSGKDGIMEDGAEEKDPGIDAVQPAEILGNASPQSAENDEKVSLPHEEIDKAYQLSGSIADSDEIMQDKFEEKLAKAHLSAVSGDIMQEELGGNISEEHLNAPNDETVQEKVERKLSEEQLNANGNKIIQERFEDKLSEEKFNVEMPKPDKKGKQVSESQQSLDEDDNISLMEEEESCEKDEKVSALQEEFDDKDESDENEEAVEMDTDEGGPAMAAGRRTAAKRKRGRPPVAQGRKPRAPPRPKEAEEELCFICFDGGDLVVCDHRGCPKVYHPSCVNRDEAYFKAKGQWTCGWHICSNCQKSSRYMCYTCTYSLCKRCIKEAEFVCVRENRGFCEDCMKIVMQIEMNKHADESTEMLDFDDRASWLYLFKDYWVDLKAKLSLTVEELTIARNPYKQTNANSGSVEPLDKKRAGRTKNEPLEDAGNASDDLGGCQASSLRSHKERASSRKKLKKRLSKEPSAKGAGSARASTSEDTEWASQELLEFVAHMRGGDKSILSQFDVQAILLEYIKQNNLRDPRRKSQVICDSRLRALFGKSRVGHLEMLKLLEPHFLTNESSPLATDDNQGGVVDPDPNQTEAEGNSDASTKLNLNVRRKTRRRGEEKGLINFDDYAAIDVHNVSLMYLRRNLMEELLDDVDMFNANVVGSFVRIRISGSVSNKDMYRLVQVVGTSKAAENYKTGKKITDITLEVLNLNKREFLTIDLISNQDFTEEECKRLRQSVKCGFIDRLTVAEVQEKAKVLHTMKVNDWLETEKSRLGNLRDRASEKGRKKEHRECVEKLQLLNTPEERIRKLNEVPEIHVDPNMDPDYDSMEDADDSSAKRQDFSKTQRSSIKERDELFARRGGSATQKYSDIVWNSNQSTSKPGCQVVLPTASADRSNELSRNQEIDSHQLPSPSTPKVEPRSAGTVVGHQKIDQPVIEPGQLSCTRPETTSQPANASSSNINETEKTWHYQDPTGKIQGPFSMAQLRKWNANKFFPANLRIWRTSEKQEDSILLADALEGKFHKDLQQPHAHQHVNSRQPTNVGALRENESQTTASSAGNYNLSDSDILTIQPSSLPQDTAGVNSPMARRPTRWDTPRDSGQQSQAYINPTLPRNSMQQPPFQGRDVRGDNNGRWNNMGRGRQNNWNSNKHRRFPDRGYERHHPYQNSSSQQFTRDQWKPQQPVGESQNHSWSSSLNNTSSHAPQTSSIDWASLQGAINRILPSSSSIPPNSGLVTVPMVTGVQQTPPNIAPPLIASVGGWAPNSVPNIRAAVTQGTVGANGNLLRQNKPSDPPASVTAGVHTVSTCSNTSDIADDSNRTPNSEPTSSAVVNFASNPPPNSESNEGTDIVPSHELNSTKECPEADDKSASEIKKMSTDGTDASNALGSSKLPDASTSVQKTEPSSAKTQSEPQSWTPTSTHQQVPTSSSVNPNPAQPLNMVWGMAPQTPNPSTGQELGNMMYSAMPGVANMGWGMMTPGLMNMTPWGAPANLNWGPSAQSPMNANLGWAIPGQPNANVNMAWGAQQQANPNAGWAMPMQVNAAQHPGWVVPNIGNANTNPAAWVAPTEGNVNQNAPVGTPMRGLSQGQVNVTATQNASRNIVCQYHENGHCKKGASCNFSHS